MKKENDGNVLDETIKLPKDFDWKMYLIKNVDLILAGINSDETAKFHYLNYGKNEYRIYYDNDKIDHFVYCGGKCGSSTLNSTLVKNHFKTIKIHSNEDFLSISNKSIFEIIKKNKQKN
jgi:hypothetical protein